MILRIFFLVDPCDGSPCKNNGTCEKTEDSFKCICAEQYEGESCELKGLYT